MLPKLKLVIYFADGFFFYDYVFDLFYLFNKPGETFQREYWLSKVSSNKTSTIFSKYNYSYNKHTRFFLIKVTQTKLKLLSSGPASAFQEISKRQTKKIHKKYKITLCHMHMKKPIIFVDKTIGYRCDCDLEIKNCYWQIIIRASIWGK